MKRNSFYLLLLTLAMSGLWSCSSDDSFDDYSKTTMEHKDVLNVDFSFSSTTRGNTREVADGECVIGVIQYAAGKLGKSVSRDAIIKAASPYIIYDSQGNISGMKLNSDTWVDLLSNWFSVTRIRSSRDLMLSLDNKDVVAARIDNSVGPCAHAVVLNGYDLVKQTMTYYDPVLGGENNVCSTSVVHDPVLLK